ncbi:hypothetical protein ACFO4L_02240 [Bacillus daqingensis]|uniref:Uncharacterized protein n=1 Tax=Bacillus daqingensis TaxID=872396 RepID=A0ABV9NTV3_9BACI
MWMLILLAAAAAAAAIGGWISFERRRRRVKAKLYDRAYYTVARFSNRTRKPGA